MAIMTLAGKNAIRANQIIQCKKECAERKITVKQWCEEHGLKEKSYWYYHKKLSDALVDIAQYEGTINQAVPVSGITDVQFMELPIEQTDNHGGKNTATMTIGRMTVTIDESISDSFLQRIMKAGANV
jgi:phosphorylcholine metabolism protein LicD